MNIILVIFASKIIDFLDTSDLEKKNISDEEKDTIRKKTLFLRFISIIIVIIYIFTFYIKAKFLNDVISSLFVMLVAYLISSWVQRHILLFYGEEVEISGEKYMRRDYKINIFSLIINVITILLCIFALFKVFEIESLLQGGGIIAGFLAFFGFTAPVWAPDFISGVSILHNDEVEVGNVVQIDELGLLSWVKSLTLSEVRLIDLSSGHPTIIRPSKFRELKVINLSKGIAGKKTKILQHIDADIGYEYTLGEVKNVFFDAWEEMIHLIDPTKIEQKFFPQDSNIRVEIVEFGNYAVKYRFFYELTNPFYIIKAQFLLNPYLQKTQKKYGIFFSTPQLFDIQHKKKI